MHHSRDNSARRDFRIALEEWQVLCSAGLLGEPEDQKVSIRDRADCIEKSELICSGGDLGFLPDLTSKGLLPRLAEVDVAS